MQHHNRLIQEAKILQLKSDLLGMEAENYRRYQNGYTEAYTEDSFYNIREQLEKIIGGLDAT